MNSVPGLIVQSGPYSWFQALIGIFCVGVGVVLLLNVRGSASNLHDRRVRFNPNFGLPVWVYRTFGAFTLVCGLMLLLQ